MKTNPVVEAFNKSVEKYPSWGSYIHLCTIVRGSGMSSNEVTKWFNKLVPIDEYDKSDKKDLIAYLHLKAQTFSEALVK